MITPEQHAEIRRLYFGEHRKVGTIVTNLGVHADTVRAAIALDTRVVRRGACRRSILDPYLPFIRDTLAQYPRLRATRLYEMLRPRGYGGSANQLRRLVRVLGPRSTSRGTAAGWSSRPKRPKSIGARSGRSGSATARGPSPAS